MKLTKLKRFNNDGLKMFSDFIDQTRVNEEHKAGQISYQNIHENSELLDHDFHSEEEIDGSIIFENRMEMGEYLIRQCPSLADMFDDFSCWTWLAALYFVQLRGPKETQRNEQFILDSYKPLLKSRSLNYRHAVWSPYFHMTKYAEETDLIKFLFTGRPNYAAGDPIEGVGGNLKILRSKSLRNTILSLYQDKNSKAVKTGAFNQVDPSNRKSKSGRGGARRFIKPLIPRLKKSFDVQAMIPENIINLCSPEIRNSKWVTGN
jgi:hypothetical protein